MLSGAADSLHFDAGALTILPGIDSVEAHFIAASQESYDAFARAGEVVLRSTAPGRWRIGDCARRILKRYEEECRPEVLLNFLIPVELKPKIFTQTEMYEGERTGCYPIAEASS